jgi:hypothetical protein
MKKLNIRDLMWFFVVIVIFIAYLSKNNNREQIKNLKDRIDSLHVVNERIYKDIEISENKIKLLKDSLNISDQLMSYYKNELEKNKKDYENNVNNVLNFSNDDKVKYLTTRLK